MLQRLGKRLTLLNLAVSGAILVTMACLALSIAERTIVQQHESDLIMYDRSMAGTMFRALSADTLYVFQTPRRYMVYLEDPNGQAYVATERQEDEQEAWDVALAIKPILEAQPKWSAVVSEPIAIGGQMIIGGIAEGDSTQGRAIDPQLLETFPRLQENMSFIQTTAWMRYPFVLLEVNGTSYRVSAIKAIATEASSLTLIMQDRTEELSARDKMRWLFAGCVGGGLILILLASVYLSGRAIEPIEQSLLQQRAFVAAASHELRTPVAALHANAEVLADAPLGEYAPYLESILNVSERIKLLVTDLMELARGDAGELSVQKTPVDAHEVAARVAQWMRPLADQRNIRLQEELSTVVLMGDPDRLRQTLLALLDNAVRYTAENGQVTLSVRRESRQAVLRVEDTGIGVPDEHKPYVFDRFYRLDAARSRNNGGFGLGLSIVKQLVEQMEGSVTLSDRAGGGSIFELRFRALE